MPDIAFHISSETADTNGHCPSGDRTRITLPIDPAIQVPNDAQPVAWRAPAPIAFGRHWNAFGSHHVTFRLHFVRARKIHLQIDFKLYTYS